MSAVLKPSKSKSADLSVRERVSKEEWDLRVDLAAAYQLAAIFKWTDLIYTHFSARLAGHDEFLINPYGLMFEEITASNLIRIDHDGKVLDDPTGLGYNEAGFVIHGCIHEARPEAQCVIHTHTRSGVAVRLNKAMTVSCRSAAERAAATGTCRSPAVRAASSPYATGGSIRTLALAPNARTTIAASAATSGGPRAKLYGMIRTAVGPPSNSRSSRWKYASSKSPIRCVAR